MSNLKTKIYIEQNGQFILKDVTDTSVTLQEIIEGPSNPNVINTVKYASDLTTQSLLDLTRDLIANDIFINNDTNSVNQLINEGVLNVPGWTFTLSSSIQSISGVEKYVVEIGQGNIKILNEHVQNVFTITKYKGLDPEQNR